jgi:predicted O-methyltransferase YrrM
VIDDINNNEQNTLWQGSSLRKYITKRRNEVQGWFSRVDAEILYTTATLQNYQNLSGSVVEIGVHHGKSLIAMCLALKHNEKAYAIDVFENYRANLDLSGMGDERILKLNLSRFNIPIDTVILDKRPSQHVKPHDILTTVGEARLFSIDGGHWAEVVQNDLSIAENSLAEHGVIALDDFHRPEWPEVSAGYFAWHANRSKSIVPLAIGSNKLYLCFDKYVDYYRKHLEDNIILSNFYKKHYMFQGQNIPIYQTYILPEFGYKERFYEYLKLYNPGCYLQLKRIRKKAYTVASGLIRML